MKAEVLELFEGFKKIIEKHDNDKSLEESRDEFIGDVVTLLSGYEIYPYVINDEEGNEEEDIDVVLNGTNIAPLLIETKTYKELKLGGVSNDTAQ